MYFKYKKRRNKIPTGNTFTTKKEYFTPEICNTSHIKLDNKTCIKINLSPSYWQSYGVPYYKTLKVSPTVELDSS